MLGIAYHNLAVEEDHCKEYDAASQSYHKAFSLVEEYNGPNDPLCIKFKKSYEDAKKKFVKNTIENKKGRMYKSTGHLGAH
mmetsp:Transcript_20318/g.17570  ORF Transcript_20318/g.17570 Transcript_20318/m.17570 type:complete len:81 (-) Transcript_20318:2609-2851(-)